MATKSGGKGPSPESGSGSGSGSGSSSGGSGETARPKAASNPPESITFTFSSRNSPFAHLSPPGSVTFVSNKRRGSESSRDRPHRKQQSSQSTFGPGWIALSPLKPVTEVPPPLFESKTPPTPPPNSNTAVFSSRPSTNVRTAPRLSLVAQHYHATSPHPSFDTPPALVTPPPQDPFGQLKRLGHDSYFPLMPPSSRAGDSRPKKKSSKQTPQLSRTKIEQPQPMHFSPQTGPSHTPTAKRFESGTSESTPRILSRIGHESAGKRPIPIPVVGSSSTSTPTQLKSRSRKSTPPHLKTTPQPPPPESGSPEPQPSIDAFRDCFGVLTTRVENVFPTRSRYRGRSDSGGAENFNVMGSGPGLSDSQCRWTRRWIRRTLRGVGSMGSGSTSSGSASTGATRLRGGGSTRGGSSLANTMIYLGLGDGVQESQETGGSAGSSSQDSLDRVRISRSNAPSPSSSSGGSSIAAPTRPSNKGKAKDNEELQGVAPNLVSTQPTVAVQS